MKYYFITYQVEWNDGSGAKLRNSIVQNIHPLDWIKDKKKDNDPERIFTLVWWTELTKEEYEKR